MFALIYMLVLQSAGGSSGVHRTSHQKAAGTGLSPFDIQLMDIVGEDGLGEQSFYS